MYLMINYYKSLIPLAINIPSPRYKLQASDFMLFGKLMALYFYIVNSNIITFDIFYRDINHRVLSHS